MISDLYPPMSPFAWRELYRSALFEPDQEQLQEHIAQAEWAIVVRARQLFGEEGNNVEEQRELEDALCALQALKNTIFGPPLAANLA